MFQAKNCLKLENGLKCYCDLVRIKRKFMENESVGVVTANAPEGEKRIYDWYSWVVIVFAIISILGFLSGHAFSMTVSLPQALYLMFNFVMFFIILAKKIEKIALWISGLTLISPILYLGTLYFALDWGSVGAFCLALTTGVCVIIQVVILIIAIKLLRRK